MKNKTIISIVIVAIVATVAIIFYSGKQNKQPIVSTENGVSPNQVETNNQIKKDQSQGKLITDDFEINLPAGWQKVAPPVGVSVMAVKIDEKIDDLAVQKINFRSYFAVSYDSTQEKSLSEYVQTIKGQLQQTIPDILFTQEQDTAINGKMAKAFEANFSQKGVNFKILMVVVEGLNNDVWVISFNTLQSVWAEYQKTFSDIVGSFKLKIKN